MPQWRWFGAVRQVQRVIELLAGCSSTPCYPCLARKWRPWVYKVLKNCLISFQVECSNSRLQFGTTCSTAGATTTTAATTTTTSSTRSWYQPCRSFATSFLFVGRMDSHAGRLQHRFTGWPHWIPMQVVGNTVSLVGSIGFPCRSFATPSHILAAWTLPCESCFLCR